MLRMRYPPTIEVARLAASETSLVSHSMRQRPLPPARGAWRLRQIQGGRTRCGCSAFMASVTTPGIVTALTALGLTNASAVFERIISLPIYPKMTESDVNDVVEAVRSIVEEYRR